MIISLFSKFGRFDPGDSLKLYSCRKKVCSKTAIWQFRTTILSKNSSTKGVEKFSEHLDIIHCRGK